jgi:hypothetical protein
LEQTNHINTGAAFNAGRGIILVFAYPAENFFHPEGQSETILGVLVKKEIFAIAWKLNNSTNKVQVYSTNLEIRQFEKEGTHETLN